MTDTEQLDHWMRHEPSYLGAFALDQLPALRPPQKNHCFIVNTQTSNLPGQHWVAVRVRYGSAWIFDPLAQPPMAELCDHLRHRVGFIHSLYLCKTKVQPSGSQTCGPHCVYFLYTFEAAASESLVLSFVHGL